jgi:hypothetical protein
MSTEELLRSLEKRLLQGDVRNSREALAGLLAEEFVEFGSSGTIYTRSEAIDALAVSVPARWTITDFHCILPAPDIALVTFRAARIVGPDTPAEFSLRSSLWRETSGRWQLWFHQGTPVRM